MLTRRLFACVMLVVACATTAAPAALLTFEEITEATAFADTNGDNKIDRPGELTSLVGTVDGITVTIRRQGGEPFDIIDNAAQLALMGGKSKVDIGESLPNGRWGTRSLDPFFSTRQDPLPGNGTSPALIIEFSAPVQVVSLLVGDYDMPLEHDFLRLLAFDGLDAKGRLVDIDAPANLMPHPTLEFNQKRMTVTDTDFGIRSVFLQAGAGMTNTGFMDFLSVFIDRIYFDADSIFLPDDIDDERNNGDNVFGTDQQSIPEPASAAVLLLTTAALLTRRPRRA